MYAHTHVLCDASDTPTRNPPSPDAPVDEGARADQPNPEQQDAQYDEADDHFAQQSDSEAEDLPEAIEEAPAAAEAADDDVIYMAPQHDEAAFMVTILRVRYPWANAFAQNPFGWRFWMHAGPARNLIRRIARILHLAQARISLLTMAGHAMRSEEHITEARILRLQILPVGRERSRTRSPDRPARPDSPQAAQAVGPAPEPVDPMH